MQPKRGAPAHVSLGEKGWGMGRRLLFSSPVHPDVSGNCEELKKGPKDLRWGREVWLSSERVPGV